MADITVKFRDGTAHTYNGAPDDTTQIQAYRRIMKDYPERADSIVGIEGAKPSSLGERLKDFATEAQIGEHGVLTSDLPQVLYGVVDSLTLGAVSDKLPEPKTQAEKESREDGRLLPLAAGRSVGGASLMKPPNFAGGSWKNVPGLAPRIAAAPTPQATAQSILSSPIFKVIAKAAGYGTAAEMIHALYGYVTGK